MSPLSKSGELAPVVVHKETKVTAMLQSKLKDIPPTTPCTTESDRTARIRDLNDQFRAGTLNDTRHLGRRLVTSGIWALGALACFDIMCKVRSFNSFDEGNDPWGEHDFGAFDYKGQKIFWKIDYYDKTEESGSPDPADPSVTCRVLTVMLADEY